MLIKENGTPIKAHRGGSIRGVSEADTQRMSTFCSVRSAQSAPTAKAHNSPLEISLAEPTTSGKGRRCSVFTTSTLMRDSRQTPPLKRPARPPDIF